MSSGCDHAIDYVYQYLDDELAWSRQARIRWHLRRCPDCGDAFQFEQRLKALIRERCCDQPPAELIDRLRALIYEEAARYDGG